MLSLYLVVSCQNCEKSADNSQTNNDHQMTLHIISESNSYVPLLLCLLPGTDKTSLDYSFTFHFDVELVCDKINNLCKHLHCLASTSWHNNWTELVNLSWVVVLINQFSTELMREKSMRRPMVPMTAEYLTLNSHE